MTNLKYDDNGLIPVIVQHAITREVLTLAYMNEESYNKTVETKETWFFSRSRQELWHKGETSGNTQKVVSIRTDCDSDALVVEVLPTGPACHTGQDTCFHNSLDKFDETVGYNVVTSLINTIKERQQTMPEGAYTTYLFEKGVDKICKKVGEESAEVIIASKNNDAEELKWEAADLIYHLLVLLQNQQVSFYDLLQVLQKRHEEKADKK
ncbi:bifunctional phosphoribosyl-AMP cyclohydrolase/phosphoribosyl-ATP diphosphatase HisIE [Psychrobacillus lasiicapitis]|uniref:Histidine biosynthesis bifunctional protein HisIE n=1 Tax=Psychrobacillus lasiicapitis TaxID=1636719 RepID=A0A544SZQ9_9BACI|nr:bifunctional phosphoribosyl-AMP cyclohydrolase/phosphoribosyl-ATP diphosphatase HisIE [Psychrobacillus lasiicapitis]TQR10659.1 bifunctional phosphoribosyl-AMP cyclohydrolase/phosphoribosyl-ATP diphosphatase HisIE [Psychrobacillus lasiicapitis]GGA43683.1 histidine biosynthesis bifunctional protein HisIE [Psychrobacillus lasiicapitis]